MIKEGRETKQGLRDLNYYGPRRVKDGAEDPPTTAGVAAESGPNAGPPAIPAVDAQD